MDSKEVRSSESWGARNVKGSKWGGVDTVGEFGGTVGSVGVKEVTLLLLAVELCFRKGIAILRPWRRYFSVWNASRRRHRWCMSDQ